jgi:hypothetical protein
LRSWGRFAEIGPVVDGFFMARWPDDTRSTVTTLALVFVVFPLLCLFAYWFVHG